MPTHLTLSELNREVRCVIDEAFDEDRWVLAEVSELNTRGRHCYMTLVEKQDHDVVAQARATIWANRLSMLKEFAGETGETLKPGMEVLLSVRVTFHERYGFNLDVRGINAEFTIGGMAKRKREVLDRLHAEGLIALNKQLPFPMVPQRIAVISSDSAAGYQDFCHQLQNNAFGYGFHCKLFASLVQGPGAEASMVAALKRVCRHAPAFDVVVLLRGGGSQVDLSCFDGYDLGASIAQCPLPVLTGVGHEKDVTVADEVAGLRAKTPTAAAEALIARVRAFDDALQLNAGRLAQGARDWAEAQRSGLEFLTYRLSVDVNRAVSERGRQVESLTRRLEAKTRGCLSAHGEQVARLGVRLAVLPGARVERERIRLGTAARELARGAAQAGREAEAAVVGMERTVRSLDPANVLRRGFSITRAGGRIVRDVSALRPGEALETQVFGGIIQSRVEATEAERAQGED